MMVNDLIDCFVNGERITKNGCVRILNNRVSKLGLHGAEGAIYYHDQLLAFGSGRFKARIVGGVLEVLDKKGKVEERIPGGEFSHVLQEISGTRLVAAHGWLFDPEMDGQQSPKAYGWELEDLHTGRSKPAYVVDNSPKYKVDPQLHGKKVFLLVLNVQTAGHLTYIAKVIAGAGGRDRLIPVETHHPRSVGKCH
jgi:hypothetical protein